MSKGYTNKEILQHASTHELVHQHLVCNCCTCAYADAFAQCDLPENERNNGKCLEGCEKWLTSKECQQLPPDYRQMCEEEIDKEREHWERILDVATMYACCSCKECGDNKEHCTPEGCSIKWAIEKYKTEEQKMLAERRSFYDTYNYFGKQLSKQLREMNNSIESRLYIAEIIAGCLKDNLSEWTLRNVTQKLDAIIQRRDKEQAKKKPTKIFISQPMNGRTDEEIIAERKDVLDALGKGFEEIPSFFQGQVYTNKPLGCLAKAIEQLAQADIAVFIDGWQNARGCKIEYECAKNYGIKRCFFYPDTKKIIYEGK